MSLWSSPRVPLGTWRGVRFALHKFISETECLVFIRYRAEKQDTLVA